MLPGSFNRNEAISSSLATQRRSGIDSGLINTVSPKANESLEGNLVNPNSSSTSSNRHQNPKSTTDNLNNNTNNRINNKQQQLARNIKPFINNQNNTAADGESENDIVNDFDLVAGISNYTRNPLSPTTIKTTAFLANSNNPTETFNVNPILNVTNSSSSNSNNTQQQQLQMTDYKHLNLNLNNSNLAANKCGSTTLTTTNAASTPPTTTATMKTLNSSPNHHHLRQNTNNGTSNNIITSAPNTPEALRRQQLLLRHHRASSSIPPSSDAMNNTNTMLLAASHPSPTIGVAKKDKMEFNQMMMKMNYEREGRPLSYHGKSTDSLSSSSPSYAVSPVNKRHVGSSIIGRNRKESSPALLNRRSMPSPYLENRLREKFDISDLDTNLPRIDLEAIENHLRIAREEERKRRTDREEIRRRLALESDDINDKPGGRKPSLHSRLQSSMNLQICFMNETASDSESPGSDTEVKSSQPPASLPCQLVNKIQQQSGNVMERNGGGSTSTSTTANSNGGGGGNTYKSNTSTSSSSAANTTNPEDFFAMQARLQAEARRALSQAKDLARFQMTQEKERRLQSPITEMVRNSLQKVGVALPNEKRRVSRQLLTELNLAQLQVIVNDLHSHIEVLNETLVSMLLERDDLHMEQDSMLVDIEDLTRYLAAKDNSPHQSLPLIQPSKTLLGKKQHST